MLVLSALSLAPIPADGSISTAFENMVEIARAAESMGYKRFWIAEHHNIPGVASSATDVLIGHVAQQTSKIRVGSGGIMLPNHAPLVIAERFGTLATLYPDRIDLGLGRAPGTDPHTARALRRSLKSTGEDFPELVAELQEYFSPSVTDQKIKAIPGFGMDVPIWILGSSLFSADYAARKGLPYAFAAHFAPAALMEASEIYHSRFTPSAELAEPYFMVCAPVVAAPSDAEALFLATSLQQKILGLITGRFPRVSPPPVEDMDQIWNQREKLAVNAFLSELIVGGPEKIKDGLYKLAQRTQANEIMIHTDLYKLSDTINSVRITAESL